MSQTADRPHLLRCDSGYESHFVDLIGAMVPPRAQLKLSERRSLPIHRQREGPAANGPKPMRGSMVLLRDADPRAY